MSELAFVIPPQMELLDTIGRKMVCLVELTTLAICSGVPKNTNQMGAKGGIRAIREIRQELDDLEVCFKIILEAPK